MKYILRATIFIICLIGMMNGIALAEQIEEWPFGQRNLPPNNLEGVMYSFDEGSNCGTFNNQFPNITTFLTVEGCNVPVGYGPCYPSYNTVGGSMCGNTRCDMYIYPFDNGLNWIKIVNGRAGFAPKTCCESDPSICWTGECYPGPCAEVEFKQDTRFVSFLASTDGTLRVILRDHRGNVLHYELININIDRVYPEPSNFTWFGFYSENVDIASMKLTGPFNGWIIDDLIVAGAPGYLPDPTPPEEGFYEWAAERLKLLIGAPHNPNGFGYEFLSSTFYPAEDIINNPLVVNWDHINKEWITGEGINNEGAVIWAFNADKNLINNLDINDMASKDFKILVEYGDQRPGDVAFIEYDTTATDEASVGYDEIIMFIEPQIDPESGATEDCIRILEEGGVHYADSAYLHALYGDDIGITPTSLFTVKSLPDSPKGKKSPYPKIPGKYKI